MFSYTVSLKEIVDETKKKEAYQLILRDKLKDTMVINKPLSQPHPHKDIMQTICSVSFKTEHRPLEGLENQIARI